MASGNLEVLERHIVKLEEAAFQAEGFQEGFQEGARRPSGFA